MSLNKNKGFTFFIMLAASALSAQMPEQVLDSFQLQKLHEVVVTATRTTRQLSSVPLPVTLISKKQLEETGVTRLNEILAEQTGIIMTPDATIGGGEGVQIQGIASDYIMVLIDGVPMVGRSSGNLDLNRLAIGNAAQVEVVKGPSSSLFGSEALGGVINIIPKEPDSDQMRIRLSHRAATFSNHNTTLGVSQRLGKTGFSFFFDRLSTDGYDLTPADQTQTVNPHFNYTLNGRVRTRLKDALSLLVSTRYFNQEFRLPSGNSEESDVNALIRVSHSSKPRSKWEYELYFTRYTTLERMVDAQDDSAFFENDFDQRLLRPEIRFTRTFSGGYQVTAGVGHTSEYLDRSLFAEAVSFNSQYLYGQVDFQPANKLNLIAGARFDRHSQYDAQLSPKLSAKYEVSENLSIKTSIGSGFKAPDFRQLYLDFTNASGGGYSVFGKAVEAVGINRLQANGEIASLAVPDSELGDPLKAERSVGINLGLQYRKGKLASEINLFRNDFRNLIDTRILASKTNGQNVFGYQNRERVYTKGAEFNIQYRILQGLRLSTGYQLLFAFDKDKKRAVANGEVFVRDPQTLETSRLKTSEYFGLENRSRHILNFKIFYEVPKWQAFANLRVNYRSRFGLADRNGNGLLDRYDTSYVDSYTLVNLALGKTFYSRFQGQIGANNLLDFKGSNPLAAQGVPMQFNPGIQVFTRLSIQL